MAADRRLLVYCHAGCELAEICEAVEIEPRDLRAPKPRPAPTPGRSVYKYRDEGGKLLYEVVRDDGKRFRQRRPDGSGGYVWRLDGVRRVLYRLPELRAAIAAKHTIWIAEGEKDADHLAALGLAATTNPGGAGNGKWLPSYTDALAGAVDVVIIADRDQAGRDHAARIHAALVPLLPHARVVEVPQDRGRAKDATDWIELGAGRADFEELARQLAGSLPVSSAAASKGIVAVRHSLTDLGNAERLIADHGATLRYCKGTGWYVWAGVRWVPSENGAHQLAVQTVRAMERVTEQTLPDPRERHELLAYAKVSQGLARLNAMVAIAARDPRVAVDAESFDADQLAVGVKNGVVMLDIGELGRAKPSHLITRQVPVAYDPHAECPKWTSFIARIFANDVDLIAYVQRAVGYTLTGSTREQAFFVAHGPGGNGKSVFTSTLLKLFGDYGREAPPSLLVAGSRDRHPTELAALRGMRLVVSHELANGAVLAEALVKQLTGGDRISARFLYRDFFDFEPTFKLWACTNYLPRVSASDHALWRRVHVIPFAVTIAADERDTRLTEALAAELPGILRWAVEGAEAWHTKGLCPPPVVLNAIDRYRTSMDSVKSFLLDACDLDGAARVYATPLYDAYRRWCADSSSTPVSIKAFGQGLRAHPALTAKKSHGSILWSGVALKEGEGESGASPCAAVGEDGEGTLRLLPPRDSVLLGSVREGTDPPHPPRRPIRFPTKAKP